MNEHAIVSVCRRRVGHARVAGLALVVAAAAGCSSPSDGIGTRRGPAPSPIESLPAAASGPRVTLAGNTHPLASAQFDQGPVPGDYPLEHLQLVLQRTSANEAALEAHIDALHDKTSPLYHRWLTAQEFGDQYGVPLTQVDRVIVWLESYGMRVESVPVSRMFLDFSGTVAQVQAAFGTEIHWLSVHGETHLGNMSDPTIPASLADVVLGVHALHDFKPHPLHHDRGPVRRGPGGWTMVGAVPSFTVDDTTNGPFYAVAPADFATIYDLDPLFSAGIRGAGQTIAVIEDTNIANASDVITFRTAFGLSGYAGTFTQMHPSNCTNPGVNGAEGEAALDAEWAGASAPDAAIELASCADNLTVFGGLTAVQNLVNGTPPPIISMSYGECESDLGTAGSQSYVNAYQQAASEGVSVVVSSGDDGAAACNADQTVATHGITVSGFTSTPYNVSVGGTDFIDTYDSKEGGLAVTAYWNVNNTATYGSALSYVPEIPWNDSCASQLVFTLEGSTQAYGATGFCSTSNGSTNFLTTGAGSGGPSTVSAQPTWQTGVVGLPTKSGGKRYVPDVSLFAANGVWSHFLIYCMSDANEGGTACEYTSIADTEANAAGGTSFAAPAFAGIMALIDQNAGVKQGNPNYDLYKLAAAEYGARGNPRCNSSGGTSAARVLPNANCIFHDVTVGDMDVPCTGSTNCFGYSKSGGKTTYGALSSSQPAFATAYGAGVGWDFATGLGTVDATNLVRAW